MQNLTDKAVAVFAFAAYHQLTSGQAVKTVVLDDGQGHHADPDAVTSLEEHGLAKVDGNAIAFSESGLAMLAKAVADLKQATRAA